MATLSVRGLDEATRKSLKHYARRSGKSVNLQVVELIRKGPGLATPASRAAAHTDLDHLAGTWSAQEAREFGRCATPFEATTYELMGNLQIVKDFLPPPDQLALREENVKVTIALSKSNISFFKRLAKEHRTPYQTMIRAILNIYADRFNERPAARRRSRGAKARG